MLENRPRNKRKERKAKVTKLAAQGYELLPPQPLRAGGHAGEARERVWPAARGEEPRRRGRAQGFRVRRLPEQGRRRRREGWHQGLGPLRGVLGPAPLPR